MDTKHGKRAHKRFLTDELGPENENNLQIGKVTWGHKYLRFCLKSSLEFLLSLPLTFSNYLIIYQHPKYHQSTGNMTFRLLTSKIDVLPISQDFPHWRLCLTSTQACLCLSIVLLVAKQLNTTLFCCKTVKYSTIVAKR